MARDVMSDLVSTTKRAPPPVAGKGAAAPGKPPAKTKAVDKNTTGKPPVSRGAVVKPAAAPRRTVTPFADTDKLALVDGVRNYRAGGNVEVAVKLIKKDSTVGSWVKAMGESENPLPAMGLLRYLHKKGCVSVGGVIMPAKAPRAPATPKGAVPKAAAPKTAPKVAAPKAATPKKPAAPKVAVPTA